MRRLALLLTPLLALAVAGGAAAAPTAGVTVEECRTSASPLERYAIFRGQMDGVGRNTDRMAMRFDLQVREPGATRYRVVDAPGLGTWIRSAPGTNGGFIWTKQVTKLDAPADYRVRVAFRWYDKAGRTIERAARRSRTCTQPDLRPDLELGALTTREGPEPGLTRYGVAVRNAGRGDAGAFEVAFGGGDEPLLVTVPGVRAGAERPVAFVAPTCVSGDTLRFEVDPRGVVDESDEQDNVLRVACPTGG
jgi:hypothetical protein